MQLPMPLALALVFACHADEAPVSVAPSSTAPVAAAAPEERLDLNLPGLAPDPSFQVARDRAAPPNAYRLPDGRSLVHDHHTDRIALLEPATGGRTELGEALLVAVPRLGWLIVPKGAGPERYYDVDRRAPRLRLLWEAPAAKEGEWSHSGLVGVERGAPLLLTRRVRRTPGQPDAPEPEVQLVRLIGAGKPEVRTLTIPLGLWPPGADSVRGRTLLLVGGGKTKDGEAVELRGWDQPFSAEVFALDLDSGKMRPIGQASGAWSMSTAVPHPYVSVRWSDHDRRARDIWFGPECVNTVDVATTTLTPCRPTAP